MRLSNMQKSLGALAQVMGSRPNSGIKYCTTTFKKKQMTVKNCIKIVCSCVFCLFIGKTRIFGSGHRFSKPSFRSKDYNWVVNFALLLRSYWKLFIPLYVKQVFLLSRCVFLFFFAFLTEKREYAGQAIYIQTSQSHLWIIIEHLSRCCSLSLFESVFFR